MTTLQIATFGKGQQGGIVSGIRNFPIHELALICLDSDKHRADKFSREIEKTRHTSYSQHRNLRKCYSGYHRKST